MFLNFLGKNIDSWRISDDMTHHTFTNSELFASNLHPFEAEVVNASNKYHIFQFMKNTIIWLIEHIP